VESKLDESELGCNQAEQRIHQLLDDRTAIKSDPSLMRHAASCAECRQLVADYETVEFGFFNTGDVRDETPADHLEPTVNEHPGHSRTHRSLGLLFAIAASTFLIISTSSNQEYYDRPTNMISRPVAQAASPSIDSQPTSSNAASTTSPMLTASNANQFLTTKVNYSDGDVPQTNFVRNLVFAQRKSLYEIAQSTPELVSSVRSSTTPWERISNHLDPLNPILIYSSEIPGIRNVQYSVGMTLELLQRSISNRGEPEPNLGFFPEVQQTIKSVA
jgi:hypothetical protein